MLSPDQSLLLAVSVLLFGAIAFVALMHRYTKTGKSLKTLGVQLVVTVLALPLITVMGIAGLLKSGVLTAFVGAALGFMFAQRREAD